MVDPHVVRERPHRAGRWEADGGVVGGDDDVAEERDVRAAGKAEAVYLGDHRLVHVKNGHAQALRAFHLPGVVVERAAAAVNGGVRIVSRAAAAREWCQVVAGAEGAPVAAQDDGVDVDIVVRVPEGGVQFGLELHGEGVELLRTVEGDPRTPLFDFVDEGLVFVCHVWPPGVGAF